MLMAATVRCWKKGRWTHRLIPQIDFWLNRNHGEVNYYLTQMLSGHGCFRAYLHRFKQNPTRDSRRSNVVNKAAWNATSTLLQKSLTDVPSVERRKARDSN
ncbi:hypothetical protein EVAR_98823_1 [Eumeta japonica]|uniref:Uncharacterized protein n=1 Tax=Eumeta variegata TaxID=151549 RepID=A0A4C1TJK2_EUMVA|nr:hypothetical protein EVAR_98823_1 [Eumeta japonica]